MRKRLLPLGLLVLAGAGIAAYVIWSRPTALVLTGIVTTNDVVVSPQIAGQIRELLVEKATRSRSDQLVAVIAPDELRADMRLLRAQRRGADVAGAGERGGAALPGAADGRPDPAGGGDARVDRGAAGGRRGRPRERAAGLRAHRRSCRSQGVVHAGAVDQARTAYDAAKAQLDVAREAGRRAASAVALARANAEQVAVRRSQVQANQHQQAAAAAQRAKADVRLAYTEIHAPIDGIVDVRAARDRRGRQRRAAGRDADQPRRPVGARRRRGDLHRPRAHRRHADRAAAVGRRARRARSSTAASTPAFATQRDVSRTKRDIKTFEIRLRVDNSDRRLAVGMTAYVLLPLAMQRGVELP